MEEEHRIAHDIIDTCKRLHQQGLLCGAEGNVSVRVGERVMITPSGRSKWRLEPEDLALLDIGGWALRGIPSSECLLHLAIYRSVPSARCVVHAHPPTAVAWSLARPDLREVPVGVLPEIILTMGALPIVPYARPGTEDMAAAVRPYLPRYRAMILARHGAVTWGVDLIEALNGMERIEHVAKVLKCAHELGGVSELPAAEIEALHAIRARIGERLL